MALDVERRRAQHRKAEVIDEPMPPMRAAPSDRKRPNRIIAFRKLAAGDSPASGNRYARRIERTPRETAPSRCCRRHRPGIALPDCVPRSRTSRAECMLDNRRLRDCAYAAKRASRGLDDRKQRRPSREMASRFAHRCRRREDRRSYSILRTSSICSTISRWAAGGIKPGFSRNMRR